MPKPKIHPYYVISPDNLPITPKGYKTYEAACRALTQWCRRFELQGYYAKADGARISLHHLSAACNITHNE